MTFSCLQVSLGGKGGRKKTTPTSRQAASTSSGTLETGSATEPNKPDSFLASVHQVSLSDSSCGRRFPGVSFLQERCERQAQTRMLKATTSIQVATGRFVPTVGLDCFPTNCRRGVGVGYSDGSSSANCAPSSIKEPRRSRLPWRVRPFRTAVVASCVLRWMLHSGVFAVRRERRLAAAAQPAVSRCLRSPNLRIRCQTIRHACAEAARERAPG